MWRAVIKRVNTCINSVIVHNTKECATSLVATKNMAAWEEYMFDTITKT